MKRPLRNLALCCAAFYLFIIGILFLTIWQKNGGHFVYALDDPYIHLALAENLAHGHYGINPGEFSSPSSSILWPFILIPFIGTRLELYLPLIWNLIFGTIAACLIGYAVAKWPPQVDESGRMAWEKQIVTAFLLVMVANLASLTFVGMEHVFQVLLAICCVIGMMEVLSGRNFPTWCLVAAVIGPMVRYESFALTVAVCLVLAGQNHWKKAAATLGISIAPLVAFSLFLKSKGMPLLPLSVLVKSGTYGASKLSVEHPHLAFIVKFVRLIRSNIYLDFSEPESWPILLFLLIFLSLTWREKNRTRRIVFASASLVAAMQLLLGHFGWFYRYEVYVLIFLTMLCMWVLGQYPRFLFGYFAMGLVFCAAPFIRATQLTAEASHDIYDQQYQMRRFVNGYYNGDYAVNDLGLVSFQRPKDRYVLDLYGLASAEAAKQTEKTPDWMEAMVHKHGIKLAMLFPEWFQIPSSWTPVAKMCVPMPSPVLAEQCMVFYSTSPEATMEIRKDLERFAPTVPKEDIFLLDPNRSEGEFPAHQPSQNSH